MSGIAENTRCPEAAAAGCGEIAERPVPDGIRERAMTYLDQGRVAHVLGCEKEAVRLARHWGEDPVDAAVAGLLHDCTKRLKYREQTELIRNSGIDCGRDLLEQPKLLHAVTGAFVAKRDFAVSGKIADGIRWHTTGRADMTLFEKIIYLADYIEETRDFEGVDKLRELAYTDIDKAMYVGLAMSIENIRSRGIEPFSDSFRAYEYYKERNEHAYS